MMKFYTNIFSLRRLDFGVPLEDIFPPNEIHPTLQNLLDETTEAIFASSANLHYMLNDYQGSLSERELLKEKLINDKLYCYSGISPAILLWLIRNFLGNLPLPLFPTYTDGKHYSWLYLAKQCKYYGTKLNYQLDLEIYRSILALPKANVLMIEALFNFLRDIATPYNYLDKNAIRDLVKYFCSSLFLRHYFCEQPRDIHKEYYPFLYYLIKNWQRIVEKNCRKSQISTLIFSEENKLFGPNIRIVKHCSCQTALTLLSKEVKEIAVQTSKPFSISSNNNLDENDNEILKNLKSTTADSLNAESLTSNTTSPSLIFSSKHTKITIKAFKPLIKVEERTAEVIENDSAINSEINFIGGEDLPILEEIEKSEGLTNSDDNYIYDDDFSGSNFKLHGEEMVEKYYCDKESVLSENNQKDNTIILLKKKLSKANKSLVDLISKVNIKFNTNQDLRVSKSGSLKSRNPKYRLLKNSVSTTQMSQMNQLKSNNLSVESPNIKYKKLLTL